MQIDSVLGFFKTVNIQFVSPPGCTQSQNLPYLICPCFIILYGQASPGIRFQEHSKCVCIFSLPSSLEMSILIIDQYSFLVPHSVRLVGYNRESCVVSPSHNCESGHDIFFDNSKLIAACSTSIRNIRKV